MLLQLDMSLYTFWKIITNEKYNVLQFLVIENNSATKYCLDGDI